MGVSGVRVWVCVGGSRVRVGVGVGVSGGGGPGSGWGCVVGGENWVGVACYGGARSVKLSGV